LDFFDPELSEKYSINKFIYSDKNKLIQQIESGSEIEDVIETKEKITDENPSKNFSEKDRYYADKIGKYCRNCNLIFELKNKLH
jgi:hypothetical protein